MERKRKKRIDRGGLRTPLEVKRCPSCKRHKTTINFYKRSGNKSHLLRSLCIACELEKQKNPLNREKKSERAKKLRTARMLLWVTWFGEIYGDNPSCQCCGRKLRWRVGNIPGVAVDGAIFDHRNGGNEPISKIYEWLSDRELSEKNKRTFLSCNFGILCRLCNISLPTVDRKKWLDNAKKYIELINVRSPRNSQTFGEKI